MRAERVCSLSHTTDENREESRVEKQVIIRHCCNEGCSATTMFTVTFSSRAYGLASQQSSSEVTVWDNVLPKEACKVLHDAASALGLGHLRFR
jgi:hypothetical protein